jgi:hypothetical protein
MEKHENRICKKISRWWIVIAALTLLSCAKTDKAFLMGQWVSTNEPYQHSTIEISADRIVFSDPNLTLPDVCMLKNISIKNKDETLEIEIEIEYMNSAGSKFKRHIVFSPRDGGNFWFRNQPKVVWKRAAGSPGSASYNIRSGPDRRFCLKEVFFS